MLVAFEDAFGNTAGLIGGISEAGFGTTAAKAKGAPCKSKQQRKNNLSIISTFVRPSEQKLLLPRAHQNHFHMSGAQIDHDISASHGPFSRFGCTAGCGHCCYATPVLIMIYGSETQRLSLPVMTAVFPIRFRCAKALVLLNVAFHPSYYYVCLMP